MLQVETNSKDYKPKYFYTSFKLLDQIHNISIKMWTTDNHPICAC